MYHGLADVALVLEVGPPLSGCIESGLTCPPFVVGAADAGPLALALAVALAAEAEAGAAAVVGAEDRGMMIGRGWWEWE
jgi:hypothetical protein